MQIFQHHVKVPHHLRKQLPAVPDHPVVPPARLKVRDKRLLALNAPSLLCNNIPAGGHPVFQALQV
jgi:hypothetical protein